MTSPSVTQVTHIFTGFDSAWTDNPRQPGAQAHLLRQADGSLSFIEPEPASFSRAQVRALQAVRNAPFHLLAVEQPTIVPNREGMRPVERVAAAVVNTRGGGVPANRGRAAMFGDGAPIRRFLKGASVTWLAYIYNLIR